MPLRRPVPPSLVAGLVAGLAALALAVAGLVVVLGPSGDEGPVALRPAAAGWGPDVVRNGSFEAGRSGWQARGGLHVAGRRVARTGGAAAVLTTRGPRPALLWDAPTTAPSVEAGLWRATAWVRGSRPGLAGRLRLTVRGGPTTTVRRMGFRLPDRRWHRVRLVARVADGRSLDLGLVTGPLRGAHVVVDGLALQRRATAAAGPAPSTPTLPSPAPGTPDPGPEDPGPTLTNGCRVSPRGVPACGAYLGGAHGSNTEPRSLEAAAGQPFGVRRTYWQAHQVDRAVDVARSDLAAGRLPWISFKLPHAWPQMAAGAGDAWARDLVARLDALDGPVWVAFHHEPENDGGDIREWVRTQERLGPIVRGGSDHVAFTVVLMGWHQLYGRAAMRFDAIWPDTAVDVAGFDVYNWQGTPVSGGSVRTKPVDLARDYWAPLQAWARSQGVAWGLAETGYTTWSADHGDVDWVRRTYADVVAHGGVAFSYFDTPLNSDADWTLGPLSKRRDFLAALRGSPRLR